MKIARYLSILGLICLTAACWGFLYEWCRVLNVGIFALNLVEAICETIKDGQ